MSRRPVMSVEQSPAEVTGREPYREHHSHYDCDEDYAHIAGRHSDRIGFGHECAAVAETDYAEVLLHEAEDDAERYARHCAEQADEPSVHEEYAHYVAALCAEASDGLEVIALVDYQHGNRADDVERGDDDYQCEEDERDEFLSFYLPGEQTGGFG